MMSRALGRAACSNLTCIAFDHGRSPYILAIMDIDSVGWRLLAYLSCAALAAFLRRVLHASSS